VRPSSGAAIGFLPAVEHFPTTAHSTLLRPGRAHSIHPNSKIAADGTAEPPRCEYFKA
jgi:hypothetical protein